MNDDALDALLASKKYGGICRETVERVLAEECAKHKSSKEAEKRARARLHQMTGAFMTPGQLRDAAKCLESHAMGDANALNRALRLHASTAERMDEIEALYARVFAATGAPRTVLDLACGLNPLYLGSIGLCVRGIDISGDQAALVNAWAARCGWDVQVSVGDLATDTALPRADIALMMKLLPVLEQQKKGAGMALLARASAPHQLTSFPTRTLGGRRVGMAQNYARWFEDNLPDSHRIVETFTCAGELCYITEAIHG